MSIAISQLTMFRWETSRDIASVAACGFDSISLWRPKVLDHGVAETRVALSDKGLIASSLQWAGGFTGSDGRSFRSSVDDALSCVDMACEVGAPVLLVHCGCRAGHTIGHAHRLLRKAIDEIAPRASECGIRLAIKPMHPAASRGWTFLTQLDDCATFIEQTGHASLGLSLDLWHFAYDEDLPTIIPRIAAMMALVQVADATELPSAEHKRLPPGLGNLPLQFLLSLLQSAGYVGPIELECIGDGVEAIGYEETLRICRKWSYSLNRIIDQPATSA